MLKNSFCNLMGQSMLLTVRAIRLHYIEEFAKGNFEITTEQFYALNLVHENEGLSQNKLSKLLCKDKANIARITGILEEKGLITREQSVQNGKRVNSIKITPRGKKVRDEIAPVVCNLRKNYLKGVDEADICACLKLMSQIRKNLEERCCENDERE